MKIELNESKIDRWRNSVKCGFCKSWWGLERWEDTEFFTCKRCGTDMLKYLQDPMPIRNTIMAIEKIFRK